MKRSIGIGLTFLLVCTIYGNILTSATPPKILTMIGNPDIIIEEGHFDGYNLFILERKCKELESNQQLVFGYEYSYSHQLPCIRGARFTVFLLH